jgi:hypothetical protein
VVAARVREATARAAGFIDRWQWRGYDPYDALQSPLFKLPGLARAKVPRLGAQQVLRRLPVNIRPLLGIRRGYNPVTLAWVAQAHAYLSEVEPDRAALHRDQSRRAVMELRRLRSQGFSGACWGYDFDWEARHASLPAYTPTVVATGFVTNSLFVVFRITGDEDALDLCRSATAFVVNDLNRTTEPDGSFCWSYSPADHQVVLNATMKGARLCAQVHSVTGDRELRDLAQRTIRFVAHGQREDGAWPYALGDPRSWVDNFHTGYILDCLDEYQRCTGDDQFSEIRERGWRYYRSAFFVDDAVPKYYDKAVYPVDANACAQSILTLARYGDLTTAWRVADWVVTHLQRDDGGFKYRLAPRYSIAIAYMRWSCAPLFAALAMLLRTLS